MNYYQILGLTRTATEEDIQNAYYKLTAQYHPDVNPEGGDKFKRINKAYETLRDPEKRKEYNATLSGGTPKPPKSGGGTSGERGGRGETGSQAGVTTGGGGLGDILGAMRGQADRNAAASRVASGGQGTAPMIEIVLTPSEAMRGTVKQIRVNGKLIKLHIRMEG